MLTVRTFIRFLSRVNMEMLYHIVIAVRMIITRETYILEILVGSPCPFTFFGMFNQEIRSAFKGYETMLASQVG
jgi:hypothetical protein